MQRECASCHRCNYHLQVSRHYHEDGMFQYNVVLIVIFTILFPRSLRLKPRTHFLEKAPEDHLEMKQTTGA